MNKLRVLLIAPECPWPPDLGLKTHLFHVIRELADGTDLTVHGFYFSEPERDRWRTFARDQGFALGGLAPVHAGWRLRWEQLRCLAAGRPLAGARYAVAAAQRSVRRNVTEAARNGCPYDWVAFEVFHTLMQLPAGTGPRRILFPVDCYSLYYSRMHEHASTAKEWLRTLYLRATCARMERRLYQGMDLIATVAEADAAALRRQLPGVRVEVLSVPVTDRPERRAFAPGGRTPRVLVGGYFAMPTIAHDARLFLEAWARQPARPSAELIVWGRGAREAGLEALCRRAGAQLVEWVDDYDSFLADADVYVYPQRFACGVQTKIQQAMRAGLAVLAAPVVMEPLGVTHGVEGWSILGPEAAASDLASLLRNLADIDRLGGAAATLMQERFAPELIGRQLNSLLADAEFSGLVHDHDHLLPC